MQLPPAIVQFARKIVEFLEPDARAQAMLIYSELREQARDAWFYRVANVPDTLDGRFEMLVLHVFLWIHRMQQEEDYEQNYAKVAENMLEMMFDDMDQGLREMGVGDMGVPRRIKAMGEALYGRMEAYEQALVSKRAVGEALVRNVYAGAIEDVRDVERLQRYLGLALEHLESRPAARLAEGTLLMPDAESLIERG